MILGFLSATGSRAFKKSGSTTKVLLDFIENEITFGNKTMSTLSSLVFVYIVEIHRWMIFYIYY